MCATTVTVPIPPQSRVLPHIPRARASPQVSDSDFWDRLGSFQNSDRVVTYQKKETDGFHLSFFPISQGRQLTGIADSD